MLDNCKKGQPDWTECEHVLCSHVHSSAASCWQDLLHTHCPQAL